MGKNENASCNNPKAEKSFKSPNWELIFSIVATVSAVASIVISILTLYQMKIDRNAAYKPSILINPIQYSFSWDSNGNLDWLDSLTSDKKIENEFKINDDGTITGNVSIPVSLIGDGVEQFTAVNVGVGSAKQIRFEWHESNITNLNNFLIKCDATKENFFEIDKSIVFDYKGGIIHMDIPSNVSLMYMLPEATETYEIPLPTAYYILIQEIIKAGGTSDIPYLILSAEYFDIQGNECSDIYMIKVQTQLYSEESTGAGNAIFELVPLFKK